jgi:hypothetical protein
MLRISVSKKGGEKGLVGFLLELLVGRNLMGVSGVLGGDWESAFPTLELLT